MQIAIIGNYKIISYDYHHSMHFYAFFLKKVLKLNSHKVKILNPSAIISQVNLKCGLIKKYLCFINSYFIFGLYLFFKVKKNETVHLDDQVNSI
tara:strand:+ start:380 stop:661 length:282 start_codon:yes stop_codon:yes gene_type:complete